MIIDEDIIGEVPFQRVEIQFIALLSADYIVNGQFQAQAALRLGKTHRYPSCRRLGG
jgi:hypothetical protein